MNNTNNSRMGRIFIALAALLAVCIARECYVCEQGSAKETVDGETIECKGTIKKRFKLIVLIIVRYPFIAEGRVSN